MKIRYLDQINKYIKYKIMPNQFWYALYVIGGLIGAVILLIWLGK